MNTHVPLSEPELATRLAAGDRAAFETIYRMYASALYRYARRNIASKEDCEEIVQEVFESLWTRRHDLGHVTLLGAYLYQMVRFKIIRFFQHESVKKKYAEHYAMFEAVYEHVEDSERDGSSSLHAQIERSIARLPARCRLAVKLRLTENLSNADIARRMNIKKATVENYIVAALSHLRASYRLAGQELGRLDR